MFFFFFFHTIILFGKLKASLVVCTHFVFIHRKKSGIKSVEILYANILKMRIKYTTNTRCRQYCSCIPTKFVTILAIYFFFKPEPYSSTEVLSENECKMKLNLDLDFFSFFPHSHRLGWKIHLFLKWIYFNKRKFHFSLKAPIDAHTKPCTLVHMPTKTGLIKRAFENTGISFNFFFFVHSTPAEGNACV